MTLTLNNFMISLEGNFATLNFRALEKLSDRDFFEVHRKTNGEFIQTHRSFKGDGPKCYKCSNPIRNASYLIRSPEGNYCISCFEDVYVSENIEQKCKSNEEKAYWDRIMKVFIHLRLQDSD